MKNIIWHTTQMTNFAEASFFISELDLQLSKDHLNIEFFKLVIN